MIGGKPALCVHDLELEEIFMEEKAGVQEKSINAADQMQEQETAKPHCGPAVP